MSNAQFINLTSVISNSSQSSQPVNVNNQSSDVQEFLLSSDEIINLSLSRLSDKYIHFFKTFDQTRFLDNGNEIEERKSVAFKLVDVWKNKSDPVPRPLSKAIKSVLGTSIDIHSIIHTTNPYRNNRNIVTLLPNLNCSNTTDLLQMNFEEFTFPKYMYSVLMDRDIRYVPVNDITVDILYDIDAKSVRAINKIKIVDDDLVTFDDGGNIIEDGSVFVYAVPFYSNRMTIPMILIPDNPDSVIQLTDRITVHVYFCQGDFFEFGARVGGKPFRVTYSHFTPRKVTDRIYEYPLFQILKGVTVLSPTAKEGGLLIAKLRREINDLIEY